MIPGDPVRLVSLRLVAADQNHGVAGIGVGDWHPRIGGTGNRQRYARHHFEGDPVLVEKQRLSAAAVEHERITPLEPDDDLVFARLLSEQVADRFLVERAGCSGPDIDPFRVGRRRVQDLLRHAVVVDHHVRTSEHSRPRT